MNQLMLTVLLAQVVPPPHASPFSLTADRGWLELVLQYVVAPLIPAIGAAVLAVLGKLVLFLHAHEGDSRVKRALAIATDYLTSAFEHVRAGIEPDLKVALADGVLTAEERENLKKKLISLALAELPGIASIRKWYGPGFDTWLSGQAEVAINKAAEAKPGPFSPP